VGKEVEINFMCGFESINLPIRKVELNCPNCQADLTLGNAVNNIRTGVQKNTLTFNSNHNWFDWHEYEFESDIIGYEEYTCVKCDVDVSEVLKNYI